MPFSNQRSEHPNSSRMPAAAVGNDTEIASTSGRTSNMLGPGGTTLRELLQLVRNTVQTVKAVNSFRRLDKHTKESIGKLLQRVEMREWCNVHGKHMSPPRLHPAIRQTVREWFELVDDDGSGTLEHEELMDALKAAQIPCDTASITEMIQLMDRSKRGCIAWHDFECFMMAEFASGKSLLSGEYMLPSGVALPFGAMIAQLRRNRILNDVMQGGAERTKWQWAEGLAQNQEAVAQAEQAIKDQKEFALKSHHKTYELTVPLGRLAQHSQAAASQPVGSSGSQQPHVSSSGGAAGTGAQTAAAQQRRQSNSAYNLTPEAQQVLAARRSSAADAAGVISPLVGSIQPASNAAGCDGEHSRGAAATVPRLNLKFQAPAGLPAPRVPAAALAEHESRPSLTARPSHIPIEQRAAQLQEVAPFWSPATTPRMQSMLAQAQKQQQHQQLSHGIAAHLNMLRSAASPTPPHEPAVAAVATVAMADCAHAPAPSTPHTEFRSMLERLPQALREPPHSTTPSSPRRRATSCSGASPRSPRHKTPSRHAVSPPRDAAGASSASGAQAADDNSSDPNWQAKASSMLARKYRLHLVSPRTQSLLNERPPSCAGQPRNASPRLGVVSEAGAAGDVEHGLCDVPKEDAETRQLLSALGSARVMPPALLLSLPAQSPGRQHRAPGTACVPSSVRTASAPTSGKKAPHVACPARTSSAAGASGASPGGARCSLVATNHGLRPLTTAASAYTSNSGAGTLKAAITSASAAKQRHSVVGKSPRYL